MVPQLLELINPNTLMEINRMLPHVAYVLGGKEKLVGMLDETLGEAGTMKPMILEMLGTPTQLALPSSARLPPTPRILPPIPPRRDCPGAAENGVIPGSQQRALASFLRRSPGGSDPG